MARGEKERLASSSLGSLQNQPWSTRHWNETVDSPEERILESKEKESFSDYFVPLGRKTDEKAGQYND
jgi:hypothetical protein